MEKTTVYLSEEQAAALRRASRATGRSQSELIRDGVDHVTKATPARVFASMGIARSATARHLDDLDGELTAILEGRVRDDRDQPTERGAS
jgi:Ribbon-helix-helix domain